MISYFLFKKIQPFFELLEKENFSVYFKELEPGLLGIRIISSKYNEMDKLEAMFLDFLKLNSDNVLRYMKFKQTLSFDYNM